MNIISLKRSPTLDLSCFSAPLNFEDWINHDFLKNFIGSSDCQWRDWDWILNRETDRVDEANWTQRRTFRIWPR